MSKRRAIISYDKLTIDQKKQILKDFPDGYINHLTTIKTPTGEMLTEFDRTILDLKRPENHEKKVKVGLLLKILEKDPTLSTIQKTGLTKKSNELFGEVARQAQKSAVKSGKPQARSNSWFV